MSNTEQQGSRKTAPTSYPCLCGGVMRVTLVEPHDPEHERRLFNCRDCRGVQNSRGQVSLNETERLAAPGSQRRAVSAIASA